MDCKYYAKSNPVESIKEHTNNLLKNLKILKKLYGKKIAESSDMNEERFWQLLEIICTYHDVGKVFSGFQNEIREKLGLDLIKTKFNNLEIKHEQISAMFVPCKKFNMTASEEKLVYQAIFYHHERDNSLFVNRNLLKEIIEEDIKPNLSEISKELQIEIAEPKTFFLSKVEEQARIVEGDILYNDYCLLKGLLHRLDHCSSAGIKVENDTNDEISEFIESFIKKNDYKLNELQLFAKDRQEENLIVIGSTGIGKTEASLLWSKNSKTFFTLPLRISINAIYDRIRESIEYNHVGLLHSTAIDYLEEKNSGEDELIKIEQSRNLYEKIITCTIDQVFTFVFKYKGYEKMYATLSYSKIVIDEIQAYSPEIVAVILKGLQMINNLGGKFMIMTATLPRIYKEKLEEWGINFEYQKFIKNTKRHKIKMFDKTINEDIEKVYKSSKDKKVLIIANTVNKAIEIYNELEKKDTKNINLLHSRFIQEDRGAKERNIREFSQEKNSVGVWVTTQIVEASLDIDFDLLYTEMSTLDSLFQRMGRCFRNREYLEEEPNIMIYTKESSGIKYVYDEEIYSKSIELLKEYDNEILSEKMKVELVDKLYSKELLGGTEFYKKFQNSFSILENIVDYDTSRKKAQEILRNINNIDVIPKIVYDENLDLFEQYENEKDVREKAKLKRKINKLFISINEKCKYSLRSYITNCPYFKERYIIDLRYDSKIGLVLKSDEEYNLQTREL